MLFFLIGPVLGIEPATAAMIGVVEGLLEAAAATMIYHRHQ
jgi:hypothetical protein